MGGLCGRYRPLTEASISLTSDGNVVVSASSGLTDQYRQPLRTRRPCICGDPQQRVEMRLSSSAAISLPQCSSIRWYHPRNAALLHKSNLKLELSQ